METSLLPNFQAYLEIVKGIAPQRWNERTTLEAARRGWKKRLCAAEAVRHDPRGRRTSWDAEIETTGQRVAR